MSEAMPFMLDMTAAWLLLMPWARPRPMFRPIWSRNKRDGEWMPRKFFTPEMASFTPPRMALPTLPMLPVMPLIMPCTICEPMDTMRPGMDASVLTRLLRNCWPARSAPDAMLLANEPTALIAPESPAPMRPGTGEL